MTFKRACLGFCVIMALGSPLLVSDLFAVAHYISAMILLALGHPLA